MKKPLISCIVCAYNAEKTIVRTLGSLINPKLIDVVEVIIIDDGSIDSTGSLISIFKVFDNVKIVSKKNEGLGISRNLGLRHATGDFITFCDADDIYFIDNCVDLTMEAVRLDCDVLISSSYAFISNKKIENFWDSHLIKLMINSSDDVSNIFKFLLQPSVCNKIFRRDFILTNEIKFGEGVLFEDVEFTSKALMLTKKICFSDRPVFLYDFHGNGSITTESSLRRYDILKNIKVVIDFMNSINLNIMQTLTLSVGLMRTTLWCLDNLPILHRKDFEEKMISAFINVKLKAKELDFQGLARVLTDPWDKRALHKVNSIWHTNG